MVYWKEQNLHVLKINVKSSMIRIIKNAKQWI